MNLNLILHYLFLHYYSLFFVDYGISDFNGQYFNPSTLSPEELFGKKNTFNNKNQNPYTTENSNANYFDSTTINPFNNENSNRQPVNFGNSNIQSFLDAYKPKNPPNPPSADQNLKRNSVNQEYKNFLQNLAGSRYFIIRYNDIIIINIKD